MSPLNIQLGLLCVSSNFTMIVQSTHNPKFLGSNPATDNPSKEKIADYSGKSLNSLCFKVMKKDLPFISNH